MLWSEILLSIYRGILKLNPFTLYRNPTIFITEIAALLTGLQFFFFETELGFFSLHICYWLWAIVIFANIAEAFAEIRSEEKTGLLRNARCATLANLYDRDGNLNVVSYKELKKGDLILVRKEETIPADGEIISGQAAIDESAVTGETHPITRRANSATRYVTAGTKIISDEIVVKVAVDPGEGFIDKMIDFVESAQRKKTINELALTILLSSMCAIFLIMVVTFQFFGIYYKVHLDITMQIALLACLVPTTIGGLSNAISIAGINRLMRKNVIAKSGQAVEAAGDVDLILLDQKQLPIKPGLSKHLTALTSTDPEQKLRDLRQEQLEGHIVGLTGDSLNDVPALAQADLGVAMNEGVQAAKEAANMIDLDSHPGKLYDIIEIGKQMLMTRGALTAWSFGNDLAKYFVLLPALLIPAFPVFEKMNFLNLSSPKNTILSTVIFNTLALVMLVPLSFTGVKLVPSKAGALLKRHLLIYGAGGIVLPFIGIKLIDLFIHWIK